MDNQTPVFTMYEGSAHASFEEHPTMTARRALIAAALVETPEWAQILQRVASTLPHRGPQAHGSAHDADDCTENAAIALAEMAASLPDSDVLKQPCVALAACLAARRRALGR